MDVILTIITIYLIYRLFRIIRFTVKRITAIRKLNKLNGYLGIRVEFLRKPLSLLFGMKKTPDATVEVGNTVYLCRFYNGRGGRSQVHFANEEYSAVFSVLLIRSFFNRSLKIKKGAQVHSTTGVNVKVNVIPRLEIPKKYDTGEYCEKKIVPVMIFSPAPSCVSYVTDEKTSIKLAFTGDEFRGIKIFTASSFVKSLEREARYFKENIDL